ncbi:MAG: HlyD family type I secretion periplasmic adaptor subunit [Spirochaetaceae bacterium]|nr:HlyD family type I secretion periplasmic adaptor subunit [Spirochaetaceae bacterium]
MAPDRPPSNWSSTRGPLALGFGALAMLVVGVIGWSVFARISGAVIVSGWVASESRNQRVEHIDGGTVRDVLVRDGDAVAAGAVLLRLDDALPRSEAAILQAQYAELVAQRNRLEAEFRGADAVVWDEELAALASADSEVADILSGQQRLFRARIDARTGEAAQLRERIGQARQEIAGLRARVLSLEQQSELIGEELTARRRLFEQGALDRGALLALERSAENLRGLVGANAAAIARTRGRIAEHEIQILQIDAARIEEAEERARAVQAKENEVREQLASVRARLGRLEVRAPVAGEVFGMTVFASGEVVRPGEPILSIVPAGADLVAVARLAPIDVDQVYPGQAATLRFSAFPARTTPEFDGRVERVSADALRDPDSGQSWYRVEVSLGGPAGGGAAGAADSAGLELTPGMPVEIHVQTGDRSPISYLAKPLTDYFLRSLREQ